MNNHRRYKIAYLARNVDDDTGHLLLKGLVHSAGLSDVDLAVFFGGKLGGSTNSIIYDLVDKNKFDGVITWASSDTDDKLGYYEKFRNFPLVSITLPIPGHPCVSIDTHEGMKSAVNHFIKHHGFCKLAFIRGPKKHVYAIQRYEGYLDALKENGIPFNETLVTHCYNWGYQDGIDAIIAASDNMGISALLELQRRGYKIPDDVAVAGHDGRSEGRQLNPSLASVAMPFLQVGETAIEKVLSLIEKRRERQDETLVSRLIPGESCGCSSLSLAEGMTDQSPIDALGEIISTFSAKKQKKATPGILERAREEIIRALTSSFLPALNDFFIRKETIRAIVEECLREFIESIIKTNSDAFLNTFHAVLTETGEKEYSFEIWQLLLLMLKNTFLSHLDCAQARSRINTITGKAQLLLTEMAGKYNVRKINEIERRLNAIRGMGNNLFAVKSFDEVLTILEKQLPVLNIKEFYIVIYQDGQSLSGPAEYSQVIYAYNEKTPYDCRAAVRFRTGEILPENYREKDFQHNSMIIPLSYNNIQFGYFYIVNGPIQKNIYGILRDQISSINYNIMLNTERNREKEFLKETLDIIHSETDVVSRQSQLIGSRTEHVSRSMQALADNIGQISTRLAEIMEIINKAVTMAGTATKVMDLLCNESKRIGDLVTIINSVAERTNILSINASIQAAHSQDTGKGFSVIAKEIKDLALQTMNSTSTIIQNIGSIQKSAHNTDEIILSVLQSINTINSLSRNIQQAVHEHAVSTNDISALLSETLSGSNEIFASIKQIATIGKSKRTDSPGAANDHDRQIDRQTITRTAAGA